MLPVFLKPYHTNFSNLIRIGRKLDGGYVIDKRVINKTKIIITCGLEAEWSFEKEFQKYNKNCKIIAFDHTVNKKFWINRFLKDFGAILAPEMAPGRGPKVTHFASGVPGFVDGL